VALVGAATLGCAGAVFADGATNARERFFLKRQNCKWTDEMGKYIYECVKANNGFNAHWCHNEALDAFCPKEDEAQAEKTAEPETASRQ